MILDDQQHSPRTAAQKRRTDWASWLIVFVLFVLPVLTVVLWRAYIRALTWDGGVSGFLMDQLWILPLAIVIAWLWAKVSGR